jgi:hypothetical protein
MIVNNVEVGRVAMSVPFSTTVRRSWVGEEGGEVDFGWEVVGLGVGRCADAY